MTRGAATLAGFGAVLLWALLALLTSLSGTVPPFQLAAMTFALGGLVGLLAMARRPGAWAAMRQPWPVWALGVGGLFGYHFLYFSALRAAPAVEASLIAYLWPLLIVIFSALLPGERLRWFHVAGAALGFAGAALIVTGGRGLALNPAHATGYGFALAAALVWAGYSVLSRRFAAVPTDIVTGFCLATSALALLCHLLLETWVTPSGAVEWLAIVALGLGPVGLAFFLWDRGVKLGDIQVLGAASYASPLLSTLVLVATGISPATWTVALACLLITAGAILASKDMLRRPVRRSARG
ncbi:aromatic amino acid exporter YddG [Palleronia sp. KMU-117]|uniref:aromatic amino acid exporter YddG n=1 Tax=Palleronia sp. KMU-117 TaxID=3434108 RepID=UPI003D71A1FA